MMAAAVEVEASAHPAVVLMFEVVHHQGSLGVRTAYWVLLQLVRDFGLAPWRAS